MIKKVIIFSSGYHGRNALRACRKKKMEVLFFIDNNKKLNTKVILGKKVYNPNIIKNTNFDYVILCGKHINSIKRQLIKLKVNKKKFLFWGKKELKLDKVNLKKRSAQLIKILKIIIYNFQKYKIKYWLDMGSLLYFLRNQDLAETSDVDFILDYKDLTQLEDICKRIASSNKSLILHRKFLYKSRYFKKKIKQISFKGVSKSLDFEPPIFEFNLFIKKKNFIENLAKEKLFNSDYCNKQVYKFYKNILIPIPYNSKKYLSDMYGKDWRVKKNFFS